MKTMTLRAAYTDEDGNAHYPMLAGISRPCGCDFIAGYPKVRRRVSRTPVMEITHGGRLRCAECNSRSYWVCFDGWGLVTEQQWQAVSS